MRSDKPLHGARMINLLINVISGIKYTFGCNHAGKPATNGISPILHPLPGEPARISSAHKLIHAIFHSVHTAKHDCWYEFTVIVTISARIYLLLTFNKY